MGNVKNEKKFYYGTLIMKRIQTSFNNGKND